MTKPEIFDIVGYLSQGMTIDENGNVIPEDKEEEEHHDKDTGQNQRTI